MKTVGVSNEWLNTERSPEKTTRWRTLVLLLADRSPVAILPSDNLGQGKDHLKTVKDLFSSTTCGECLHLVRASVKD